MNKIQIKIVIFVFLFWLRCLGHAAAGPCSKHGSTRRYPQTACMICLPDVILGTRLDAPLRWSLFCWHLAPNFNRHCTGIIRFTSKKNNLTLCSAFEPRKQEHLSTLYEFGLYKQNAIRASPAGRPKRTPRVRTRPCE
jgi:hypothetical protein